MRRLLPLILLCGCHYHVNLEGTYQLQWVALAGQLGACQPLVPADTLTLPDTDADPAVYSSAAGPVSAEIVVHADNSVSIDAVTLGDFEIDAAKVQRMQTGSGLRGDYSIHMGSLDCLMTLLGTGP